MDKSEPWTSNWYLRRPFRFSGLHTTLEGIKRHTSGGSSSIRVKSDKKEGVEDPRVSIIKVDTKPRIREGGRRSGERQITEDGEYEEVVEGQVTEEGSQICLREDKNCQ